VREIIGGKLAPDRSSLSCPWLSLWALTGRIFNPLGPGTDHQRQVRQRVEFTAPKSRRGFFFNHALHRLKSPFTTSSFFPSRCRTLYSVDDKGLRQNPRDRAMLDNSAHASAGGGLVVEYTVSLRPVVMR
jgi:hypothetical protein